MTAINSSTSSLRSCFESYVPQRRMDKETTPTPNAHPSAKYRGAVVEVSWANCQHTPVHSLRINLICIHLSARSFDRALHGSPLTTGPSTAASFLSAGRCPSEPCPGSRLRKRIRPAPVSDFGRCPNIRVLNDKRKPIGYLDIKTIKRKFEQGVAGSGDVLCE
jgi:hypothetical protein